MLTRARKRKKKTFLHFNDLRKSLFLFFCFFSFVRSLVINQHLTAICVFGWGGYDVDLSSLYFFPFACLVWRLAGIKAVVMAMTVMMGSADRFYFFKYIFIFLLCVCVCGKRSMPQNELPRIFFFFFKFKFCHIVFFFKYFSFTILASISIRQRMSNYFENVKLFKI
jgi:hypothetical protein